MKKIANGTESKCLQKRNGFNPSKFFVQILLASVMLAWTLQTIFATFICLKTLRQAIFAKFICLKILRHYLHPKHQNFSI